MTIQLSKELHPFDIVTQQINTETPHYYVVLEHSPTAIVLLRALINENNEITGFGTNLVIHTIDMAYDMVGTLDSFDQSKTKAYTNQLKQVKHSYSKQIEKAIVLKDNVFIPLGE